MMNDGDYYDKKLQKHSDSAFYAGLCFVVVCILIVGWSLMKRLFGI